MVNKQVGYIASAHLLLISVATGYFFISKIPFTPTGEEHKVLYDNVNTEKAGVLSERAARGKILFQSKCASCHNIFKDATGPKLGDAINNDRWSDRKKLYAWIRNPQAFMKNDPYTRQLKEQFGSEMTAFPNITDEDIDAIVEYITAVTLRQPAD